MAFKIQESIHNYLKFLENIESCSPLTLKAYKTDLIQAYNYDKINENDSHYLINSSEELWLITRQALNQWSSLSLSSRNRKIATLKSFFSWLYDQKLIDSTMSHRLICPKIPKKIPHFISVDEVASIIDYYKNFAETKTEHQEFCLFTLIYGSGLRISEACHLKWKDISLEQRRLLILGKGNKERVVILPEFCINYLKKYKELYCNESNSQKHTTTNLAGSLGLTDFSSASLSANSKQSRNVGYKKDSKIVATSSSLFVFGHEPLNPRQGYNMIRNCGIKAGLLNPLHPHALRHSFATHLLASGANLRILQKILGHESLQATEKYTHLNVDQLAQTLQRSHPLSKLKKV